MSRNTRDGFVAVMAAAGFGLFSKQRDTTLNSSSVSAAAAAPAATTEAEAGSAQAFSGLAAVEEGSRRASTDSGSAAEVDPLSQQQEIIVERERRHVPQ